GSNSATDPEVVELSRHTSMDGPVLNGTCEHFVGQQRDVTVDDRILVGDDANQDASVLQIFKRCTHGETIAEIARDLDDVATVINIGSGGIRIIAYPTSPVVMEELLEGKRFVMSCFCNRSLLTHHQHCLVANG